MRVVSLGEKLKTKIIYLNDDLKFEPETISCINGFLSFLNDKLFVSVVCFNDI